MDQRVKGLWTEALRSGEFTQGEGRLRDHNDNYCCLGVLSEVYRNDTGKGRWEADNIFRVDSTGSSYSLVPEVLLWAGLSGGYGANVDVVAGGQTVHRSLIDLNDGFGLEDDNRTYRYSFEEIADVVDAQL
jgi:hypothetical protein